MFVDVPGGRVYCRTVGHGAPGLPLLVLHGGPGVPHDYLEPLEALADERPVVFYDQLGCGLSDRPDDPALFTVSRFVAELDAVRRALKLSRLHLLGQSWGTMLAVDYLLEKGQAGVAGLVLSGPCLSARQFAADQREHLAQMPEDVRLAIAAAEATADFASPAYEAAVTAFYARHVCRLDPWPECLTRAIEKMGHPVYARMWGPSEFTVTGCLAGYDRTGDLGGLRLPALFTCGRFDEATPATTALYRSLLPGARLRVFEDASHEHHLERPGDYLETVAAFLRQAEAGPPGRP
ncbi:proline iminopeptidase-family hydrolase [Solidesulfovibrio carbinoliphilus]|nr:proline iminopeptidase-family hydrolase [Solidesulfovibrio carbinoliphilus]